jgi:hypothetical protein
MVLVKYYLAFIQNTVASVRHDTKHDTALSITSFNIMTLLSITWMSLSITELNTVC